MFAWVFNLNAEQELIDRSHGAMTAGREQKLRAMLRHAARLLGPGDCVIGPGSVPANHGAGGYHGRAWCPTPRALQQIQAASANVPAAPGFDVLRQVNHREFCFALGDTLPGAVWVTGLEQILTTIRQHENQLWVCKQPFGFAGSGLLRLQHSAVRKFALRWLKSSLNKFGGLQLEPWVERVLDLATHGYVFANGDCRFGQVVAQVCDDRGRWIQSRELRSGELSPAQLDLLDQTAKKVATALHRAGYFGAFGIDAFVWRDGSGERLQPLSEINARYSMGWSLGMDGWQAPFQ